MSTTPHHPATFQLPPRRILIVDDNPAIHDDFRKILCPARSEAESSLAGAEAILFEEAAAEPTGTNFEVDSAFQGQEALDKVRAAAQADRPYSLAFMDVRMPPGWDGIETITHIWREHPAIQVVICTAYSDYSWQQIVKTLGENDNLVILKKPFDNVEVLQLAHALTKKWLLNQQAADKLDHLDRLVAERTRELQQANLKLRGEIAERVQAEEALRLSEERFQKAFSAGPVSMAIATLRSGQYLDVNEACLSLLGYQRDQLIGCSVEALNLFVDAHQRQEVLERIRRDKSLRDFPARMLTRSGQVREVLISGEWIDLQIEPCALFLFYDVTDRLALETQLRQAQKMEAVGQLASGLAHDFNNLLTIIQGHVALRLATAQLDLDMADSLTEIGHAADRAALLTRQLLAFSRRQAIQRRVLPLNGLIEQMAAMLQRLLGEAVKLSCPLAEPLPHILGDPASLEQIIVNLAVNARDAMPNGGELAISTAAVQVDAPWCQRNPEARPGAFVRLRVADTGCGMESAVLAHVFEPFFTTKEIGQGSGLGLSTVHGIVKQHEGWIEVVSHVGRGSTFDLFFPVTDQPLPPPPAPEAPAGAPVTATHSHTLLVVEDEPMLRQLAATILRRHGYRIIEAADGPEALDRWRQHGDEIDLVLTDLVMPGGLSGGQLATQLLEQRPSLKIVFISGYSPEIAGTAFAQNNPKNFLQKPFKPDTLLQVIRNCLEPAAP